MIESPPQTTDNPCKNCGRCCEHIGTPPGFSAYATRDGSVPVECLRDSEDHEIYKAMPQELRDELVAYFEGMMANERPDRSGYECPCLWYDPMTQQCKHHDHRPSTCREFEVGGDGCNRFRAEAGLAQLTIGAT